MSNINQITPFLHVPDFQKALDLFTRVLRFQLLYQEEGYAYLENGPAGLRVQHVPTCMPIPAQPPRMSVYVDVEDVDALFDEWKNELLSLPAEDFDPVLDKCWGQREFQVRLPDGSWMAFGMAIPEGAELQQ